MQMIFSKMLKSQQLLKNLYPKRFDLLLLIKNKTVGSDQDMSCFVCSPLLYRKLSDLSRKMHFLKLFLFFTGSISEEFSDLDVREMLLNRLRDSVASELPKIKPGGIWSLYQKKHLNKNKSEENSVMDMLWDRVKSQA